MKAFKKLFVILFINILALFTITCTTNTNNNIGLNNDFFPYGKSSINSQAPTYITNYKLRLTTFSGISEKLISTHFIKRDSTFSTPVLTTATGTPIELVDNKFIKLLCFDNPSYANLNSNSLLNGWLSSSVNYIITVSSLTGEVRNVTGQLNSETAKSLSYTTTFFPDGIYTLINNTDETLNQIGYYQPVIEKNILTGIVYKQIKVGIDFANNFDSSMPNYSPNPLSYGVWGIDENFFFPLFLVDVSNVVFLRMRRYQY